MSLIATHHGARPFGGDASQRWGVSSPLFFHRLRVPDGFASRCPTCYAADIECIQARSRRLFSRGRRLVMDETAGMSAPAGASPVTEAPQASATSHTNTRRPWAGALNLAEAGLLTDVGLTLDLASIYLPMLGAAFIPLTPAPFAILYLRRGARVTMLAALVAGFLMTALTGPHFGWRLSLQALVGMAMGVAMRRQWRPLPAIALGTLIVTLVAYGAAFGAVIALGLPLHDLYLELRNTLVSLTWLLQTSATLLGSQPLWAQAAPWVASATAFVLRYWVAMFAAYVAALALPTVVLYYGVASTTAYALGYAVKPFPPPWVWRALRLIGLALTPLVWVAALALRIVTAPLWGPVWLTRWVARRRRAARLRAHQASITAENQEPKDLPAEPVATR